MLASRFPEAVLSDLRPTFEAHVINTAPLQGLPVADGHVFHAHSATLVEEKVERGSAGIGSPSAQSSPKILQGYLQHK